ncbi:MAG TPA: ABC transporter permease [Puia sp.]|nr:ABC transporter permease [Puia sp.]
MFSNYFKTAFRSFRKNKVITIINILGLSVGISAALIIYLIVQYDFSFDKFEPGRERIYRIVSEGPGWHNSGVPAPLHEAVQREIPGVEKMAALFQFNDWNIKVTIPRGNDKTPPVFKKQDNITFADGDYFSLFPHQWLAGNAGTSLKEPFQVVLSENRAKTYFPGIPVTDIVGRTVIFSDTIRTTVSGIVKDLDAHTDFDNQVFIALSTIPGSGLKPYYNWTDWGSTNSNTQALVRLVPGQSPQKIERQIRTMVDKYNKAASITEQTKFYLQPLDDIHFNALYDGVASKSTLFDLTLLAVFLLLLGAINFINLSTAQAAQRAKEIGIRKTLGSSKLQLVIQFLQETFLLTLATTGLSVLITPLLLKAFAGFIPKGLAFNGIWQPHVLIFLAILIITVSFLAGLYPALVLTKFRPVLVLKNQHTSLAGNTRGAWLRKTFTVSQFVIAQVFVIGTLMVNRQIHYSLEKDMGFRKNAIVNFYVPFDFFKPDNKKFVLQQQLRAIPGIEAVSLGNQSPAFGGRMSTQIKFNDGKKEVKIAPDTRSGDTGFISLYHLRLLAGRNVLPTDSATELLINETLARRLGFQHPQAALGQFIGFSGHSLPVVGVMADFNLTSVRTAINPLIFYSEPKFGYVMHVALQPNPGSWNTTIAKMQTAWKTVYPDLDFDYTFLDKSIESFYKEDRDLSKLLSWSTGITIFISCLGLLGLVIFTANQRTKEIGIRKVLGATVTQIIALLSKDFVKLVTLAFLIAVPVAWWAIHQWLQNFAYHATAEWWIFAIGGVLMLLMALLILCIRAGRAALANPVESLRTE